MKIPGKKVMRPKIGRRWSWKEYAEKWPSSKPEGKVLIFPQIYLTTTKY